MFKKSSLLVIVFGVLFTVVGLASAQDRPLRQPDLRGGMLDQLMQVITNTTGLTAQDIRTQLNEETSLADIITANGGDVNSVIVEVEALITERLNTAIENGRMSEENVATMLENLNENLTNIVNQDGLVRNLRNRDLRERFDGDMLRGVVGALTEVTGLDPQEIAQQVRDGETIASLLEANGSSVDAVVSDLVAQATDRVNRAVEEDRLDEEQATMLLENLTTRLTDVLNGNGAGIFNRIREERAGRTPSIRDDFQRGLLRQVVESTGLEAQDVLQQLRDGTTLGDVLTNAGVDVEVFIDEQVDALENRLETAVENGQMSQDVASARLQLLEAQLNDAMNRSLAPQQ